MPTTRRTALVTGAGRNIGRAVVHVLAEDGFNVVINGSRDQAACDKVAEEARARGAEALVVMADVGRAEECARLAAAAIDRFGGVDVLVNNAALRPSKPFLEMTDEEWRRVIAVDLDASVHLARACLPGMIERGWGRIVQFAGMNAIHGYSGRAPVSVAKHGSWGLTKALAKEFGPKGITVNAISPGPIASDEEMDDKTKAYRATMVERIPVGRQGSPAEVAAMLRFLVSDAASYVTGQMIQVNGGGQT